MQFARSRLIVFGPLACALFLTSSTTGLAQSLIAHWKLDESSGTSAADSSGSGNTGTVTGTATWTAGMINNCFQFNGSTKIQAAGLLGNRTNITVAAWANLTTADTSGSTVISLGEHFYLRLDESGGTNAAFYNGSTYVTVSVSTSYAGTGWHHFAAVFDDTNDLFKLYVDGVQVASTSTTASISYSGLNSNTVLGRHSNGGTTGYDFTGTIDDVRVYDYALSANDVAKLYGLIGYWKLSETSGTTATDSTFFAQNGTVNGVPGWSTRCNGTGVFDFNGSNQYISISNASHLKPTAALTIAGWIKGDSWGSGSDVDVILRKGDADPNNYQLAIADGHVALYLDDSDGVGIRGNTVLLPGQWYHVAATWNGSSVSIYVNGQLDNTPVARTGTIGSDTRPLYIGGQTSGDNFDGMMYDVRLYSRALLPSEIVEFYGLIGHWALDETSGATAADSSGMARNATVTGTAAWTTGKINGGQQFNGATKDLVTGLLNKPKNVTIAAWVNLTTADSGGSEVVSLGDHFRLRLDAAGMTRAAIYNGSTWPELAISQTFAGTGWHHLAAVFDDDNNLLTIYVDGVQAGSTTVSQSISYAGLNSNTVLGRHSNGGTTAYDFTGTLDDVRIYNRALCPAEVQTLASGGFQGVRIIKWVEIQ